MPSSPVCWCLLVLVATVAAARILPRRHNAPDTRAIASEFAPDLVPAASGHEHGRVQIKVYRGPDEHGDHDHFAPHGYWIKQPADDDHH